MCPEPPAVLTYDCSARDLSDHIMKFADDTECGWTNNDECVYRQEVEEPVQSKNNPSIIKKARRRLCFLRRLNRASLSPADLTSFWCGGERTDILHHCLLWGTVLRQQPPFLGGHLCRQVQKQRVMHHEGSHPPSIQTIHPLLPSDNSQNNNTASAASRQRL